MGFICERLSEEDGKYIQSFQFCNPLGRMNELCSIPRNWAVDREKKYYLICLGGQGFTYKEEYPPYYYRLIIQDVAIKIEARFESAGDGTSGVRMIWRINSIDVPRSLESISQENVLSIVKEALTAYSHIHKGDNIIVIDFSRVATPYYYDIDGGRSDD